MTGRLAAHIEAMGAHVLEHVAVADWRARERDCQRPEIAFEAEIGHHGRDDAGLGEAAVGLPALRDHRQQLIAIDDAPALVGDEHAVAVAVERDADVGAHFLHFLAKRRGLGRAAFAIDVEAVGLDPERDHLGAQFPQRLRRQRGRPRRWRNRPPRAGPRATGCAAACAWRTRRSGPARRRCAWRDRDPRSSPAS